MKKSTVKSPEKYIVSSYKSEGFFYNIDEINQHELMYVVNNRSIVFSIVIGETEVKKEIKALEKQFRVKAISTPIVDTLPIKEKIVAPDKPNTLTEDFTLKMLSVIINNSEPWK